MKNRHLLLRRNMKEKRIDECCGDVPSLSEKMQHDLQLCHLLRVWRLCPSSKRGADSHVSFGSAQEAEREKIIFQTRGINN